MTASRTISQILADLGVSHRGGNGAPYGKHALFYAGRFIGFYSAHEVCSLIYEYGLEG